MGASGVTEEPNEQKHTHWWSRVKDVSVDWSGVKDFLLNYILNYATLLSTLLYLYVTALGIIYSAALYGKFAINIFDYSEISDFLLAAFKNPIALFSAVLVGLLAAIGVAGVFFFATASRQPGQVRTWDKETQRWVEETDTAKIVAIERRSERDFKRSIRKRTLEAAIFTAILASLTFLVPYYFASRTASSIKDGEKPAVDVRYRSFSGSAGQVTEPELELIGATQKAAFFYDVGEKRTIVIPQAQIVSIEVPEQD
jgi:hypothetical protein